MKKELSKNVLQVLGNNSRIVSKQVEEWFYSDMIAECFDLKIASPIEAYL